MIDHGLLDGLLLVKEPQHSPHRTEVCVVRRSPRDYPAAHPTRPALIAEVALPVGQREHQLAHRDERNRFAHEVDCGMPG
ncbi:MAG: hypothetical protein Q7W02_14365 [Candidatus Rokubacteria bacterium]|nr:hypothetical protein [Candidatus Rokubacteria bacterium]